jgi:hypothetical protein
LRICEGRTNVKSCLVVCIFCFVLVELKKIISKKWIVADNFIVDEIPSKGGRSGGGVFFGVVFNFEGPLVEWLGVPGCLGELNKDSKEDYGC